MMGGCRCRRLVVEVVAMVYVRRSRPRDDDTAQVIIISFPSSSLLFFFLKRQPIN